MPCVDVPSSPKDLKVQACLAMHSAFSLLWHQYLLRGIIMHSLANNPLIWIQENKGGPTPGYQNKELVLLGGSRRFRITMYGKDVSG